MPFPSAAGRLMCGAQLITEAVVRTRLAGACGIQVTGQTVEHDGGAVAAQPWCLVPVEAVQEGALLGPGQCRAA